VQYLHGNQEGHAGMLHRKTDKMKILKRIWFIFLVLINLTILFIPEMLYWVWKGRGFLGDRLNSLYAKWVLPCLLLLLISCEKPAFENKCKECSFIEDNQLITVFVCGEELLKFERDNIKCITTTCKN
jgi:hypothetical protein